MDWIFIDTSRTDRERLRESMEGVVNHTATGQYSRACATILNEYICVSNYPSCDLSHSEPRPIMVRTTQNTPITSAQELHCLPPSPSSFPLPLSLPPLPSPSSPSLPIQPCQSFCRRVHEVCGEEIRGLSSFTSLLKEVEVTFDCEALPMPNGGEAPECYQQTRTLARVASSPSKWAGLLEEACE